MSKHPDIDIDFADCRAALALLPAVPAMIERIDDQGNIKRQAHPSGAYFQDIPVDPFTRRAAISYEEADERGYFKIDFLNQSVYTEIRDEDHLVELLNREPPWELLDEQLFVQQLMHIYNHFDIVQSIAPRSIEDLAVVLALIRPAKRHLVGQPRNIIDQEVWTKDSEGYFFKRAHAISYAALIVVQMNLIVERLRADD